MIPSRTQFRLDLSRFTKQARTRENLDNQWAAIAHHPNTISGSMVAPLKTWYEVSGTPYESHMDKAKKNREEAEKRLTTKQAFKAGILLKLAEARPTLEQLEQTLDKLLTKEAVLDQLGNVLGQSLAIGGAGVMNIANKGYDAATTVGLGLPILLGGTAGYSMGKMRPHDNPEQVKRELLRDEYLRLADEAKRRTTLKRLQERSPGSIIQLS